MSLSFQESRLIAVPTMFAHVALWADGSGAEGLPAYALAALIGLGIVLCALLACELMGMRYIPNNRVGIIERLWSPKGAVSEGCIIALNGEAGFQADLLRGGVHWGLWRWQFRIHKIPLVTVPQGKIGYVYARDGEPLAPSRLLAVRAVDQACHIDRDDRIGCRREALLQRREIRTRLAVQEQRCQNE